MIGHTVFWVFGIAFGLWLTIHCPRVAVREFRSGIAIGRHGEYPRETRPAHFWTTLAVTFFAGLLAILFIASGVGVIATGQDNPGEILAWWKASLSGARAT